jgi:uncharacterized repeat protein (TIGR03803 family)
MVDMRWNINAINHQGGRKMKIQKSGQVRRIRAIACPLIALAVTRVSPAATLSTLASFNGANGNAPQAGLIADASGNFYGTTTLGHGGVGDVFELPAGSNAIDSLANFEQTDGDEPECSLVFDKSGNLYGTTAFEGSGGGTLFKLAAGSNTITEPVTFNGSNGADSQAGMIQGNSGILYGTTSSGGANNLGTIFKFVPSSNALTTLASFNSANGAFPEDSLVIDSAGNLYGTAHQGGANGVGTIFELPAGSHTITVLASFNGANGSLPQASLTADSAGDLFGTTLLGGVNNVGTVFELAAGSNNIAALASFNNANGAFPKGGVIADAAGNLYGTTFAGGANSVGSVFVLDSGSGTITTLASFNASNGEQPVGNLLADSAGNLYGTTGGGGADLDGTIFEVSGTGFVVPEPSSLALLGLAGAATLARRRGRAR